MEALFGSLLRFIGSVLAALFDIVGSYGIAIVLLTIVIRTALLPLTIKQTRSMAEMQAIQPLVKEIQKKHKGNRQKLNEELMKVYKEHKVNPLGGCLPLLMQFPFFIALYAVLNASTPALAIPEGDFQAGSVPDSAVCVPFLDENGDGVNELPRLRTPGSNEIDCSNGTDATFDVEEWRTRSNNVLDNAPPEVFRCTETEGSDTTPDHFLCRTPLGTGHLPRTSGLYQEILEGDPAFLGMELSCSPTAASSQEGFAQCSKGTRSAGGAPLVGYWGLVVLMVGTTWYQQRQMQQMSGQSNPQMQMMGRIMPVFLGFISLSIPAGVLLYWVTTNFWQVGQQRVMMKRRGTPPSPDGQRAKPQAPGPKGGAKKPPASPPAKPRPTGAGRGGSGRSGGGSRKKRRKR